MLLSGCRTASSSLPHELAGQVLNYPEALNIIASSFYWNENDENADKAKQQWVDEMLERYGVEINVISNSFSNGMPIMIAGQKIEDIFSGNESFSGMVQIQSMYDLQMVVDSGLAVPLDDYLVDNPIWNALPDEVKSIFKINGHIYAIPTHVSTYLNSRNIYKEALEQTGINVTDLKSLKEFAIAYTKLSGNYAIGSYGISRLKDIFNAFGLYNGVALDSAFNYDPTEDCIVDFLTKDAAIDALEYLRELYTAGALELSFDSPYKSSDDFNNHKSASEYGLYSSGILNNFNEVITLNPNYPQVLSTSVSGYIMTKDTSQPKETVNFFVNMLFGSEENYLECWLGSSDHYTLNSDGTVTIKMIINSDGSYVAPAMPNLTGDLTDVFPYSDARLLYSQDGVINMDSETTAGVRNNNYIVLSDALKKGIVIKIPPTYSLIHSVSYYSNQEYTNDLCKTCIKDAITNTNWTVQQIVDEYRAEMLNLGGNQMLDEMNAAIGKKTAYYYG